MNNKLTIFLLSIICFSFTSQKSTDYARHLELTLLFYECQRSGPLPETNRIYWRHDSMVDAGADVGLDLTGGYYDAGDNIKFNFPQTYTLTLLAWSGIEFAEGYKNSGQWKYILEAVKWGTDYFIKCHSAKDTLYVQVGSATFDHGAWVPPEYINYEYPSYKIDAENPGSEVAAETAAALTAASILFKDEDSKYSATLLKHAIEIYDLADTYRGDYTKAVPGAQGYYSSFSGYEDELAWGAMWLYRATGEEAYYEKYKVLTDKNEDPWDRFRYSGSRDPITWDDKKSGSYVLAAITTKDEVRMKIADAYCDAIISGPTTPGGLWYNSGLSIWGSNRYAANAASLVAIYANVLSENDSKRKTFIDFVKKQIDYILGDNPAGVNYVVGAEDNSPKSVHHRGASGTYGPEDTCIPKENVYTLYGALAGGPASDDTYKDSRADYQMNEVALDYNAGFTVCLAGLVTWGLGKSDGPQTFERAWPFRPPKGAFVVTINKDGLTIASENGLKCSGWCVSFKSEAKIANVWHSKAVSLDSPNFTVCNERETGYLDGEGTTQYASWYAENFVEPKEFVVQCDGYHPQGPSEAPAYKPEFGHLYKVTSPGGLENTEALFEETECWPSFIC